MPKYYCELVCGDKFALFRCCLWGLWFGGIKNGLENDGHGSGTGIGLFELGLVNVAGPTGRGLHRGRRVGAAVGLRTRSFENRFQRFGPIRDGLDAISELFDRRMKSVDEGSVPNSGSAVTLNGFEAWQRKIIFVQKFNFLLPFKYLKLIFSSKSSLLLKAHFSPAFLFHLKYEIQNFLFSFLFRKNQTILPDSRASVIERKLTDSVDSSFTAEASQKMENIAPDDPPISFSDTCPIIRNRRVGFLVKLSPDSRKTDFSFLAPRLKVDPQSASPDPVSIFKRSKSINKQCLKQRVQLNVIMDNVFSQII